MAQTTPGALAWRHFGLSLRNGFVLLVPAAPLGVLIYFALEHQSQALDAVHVPPLRNKTGDYWAVLVFGVGAYSLATLFYGAILLGIPALLFGALRIWPMRWLLRTCLAEPTSPNVELGLVGTLLLFESPLLVAALFGASSQSLGFCALVSLPFLGGALWAAWQLLRAEQLTPAPASAD